MKIVRLVLLLSLVGVPAACDRASVTEPSQSEKASAEIGPRLDTGTVTDSTTARDGAGPIIGSGT